MAVPREGKEGSDLSIEVTSLDVSENAENITVHSPLTVSPEPKPGVCRPQTIVHPVMILVQLCFSGTCLLLSSSLLLLLYHENNSRSRTRSSTTVLVLALVQY